MALNWEPKRLKHAVDGGGLNLPTPYSVDRDGREFYKCSGVGMNSCSRIVKSNAMIDISMIPDVDGDFCCDACFSILTVGHDSKAAKYTAISILEQVGAPTDFMDDLNGKLLIKASGKALRRKG